MDLTQAELGAKLGVNVQSVARWEKGLCEMPGTAEKLLRAVFLADNLSEKDDINTLKRLLTTVLDELDLLDEPPPAQANFKLEDTWTEVRPKQAG